MWASHFVRNENNLSISSWLTIEVQVCQNAGLPNTRPMNLVSFMPIIYKHECFFIECLHNKDILYNMTVNSEMLWCVNIIPTIVNYIFCLCPYFFGHILGYLCIWSVIHQYSTRSIYHHDCSDVFIKIATRPSLDIFP